MKLNWNFQWGGVSNKKPSVGGPAWIFSGATKCENVIQLLNKEINFKC